MLLARMALSLLSGATGILVVYFGIAIFQEHIGASKFMEKFTPAPWNVAILIGLLSLGALLIVGRRLRGILGINHIRRGIVVAGIYLAITSLWILINPH